MLISSTILAINTQRNSDALKNANFNFICIVRDGISASVLSEIKDTLHSKKIGHLLPVLHNENESAFTIIPECLEAAIKLIKRLLWENGFLLNTKIVLTNPEIKLLKDFGENL